MTRFWLSSVAAAAILAVSGAAHAADMDRIIYSPDVDQTVPVEIGSGWYVRGDIGYSVDTSGNGNNYFTPTNQQFDIGRFGAESELQGGVGVGYQFTDFLRGDVTAEYMAGDFSGSTPDVSGRGEFDAGVFLGNAYFDLGTVKGVTPYIGGGLGGTYVDYSNISGSFQGGQTVRFDGASGWRLTYALMAGVGIEVAENVKLDIGYRYLDTEGGRTFANAAFGRGSDTGIAKHEIRAGIRFALW